MLNIDMLLEDPELGPLIQETLLDMQSNFQHEEIVQYAACMQVLLIQSFKSLDELTNIIEEQGVLIENTLSRMSAGNNLLSDEIAELCELYRSQAGIQKRIHEFQIKKVTEEFLNSRREIAGKGGKARADKLILLKKETIALYESRHWPSAAAAALEIAPKIVESSKKLGINLLPTTNAPLKWIRHHRRSQESNSN